MEIISSSDSNDLMNKNKMIDILYNLYFKEIIDSLNNAIDKLNRIKNYFENNYLNN